MSDLTISASFTISDVPATGLVLAEINFILVSQHKSTGALVTIWNNEHPTVEVTGLGTYFKIYAAADLNTYNYYAGSAYIGAALVDNSHTLAGIGVDTSSILKRGVASYEDDSDFETGSLGEMILAAFESDRDGTDWVIRKTDGTTFNTRELTLDADANPVIGVD